MWKQSITYILAEEDRTVLRSRYPTRTFTTTNNDNLGGKDDMSFSKYVTPKKVVLGRAWPMVRDEEVIPRCPTRVIIISVGVVTIFENDLSPLLSGLF
jgi:hypothetical protein